MSWEAGEAAAACAGFGTVAAIFFGLHQFTLQRGVERSKAALDLAMEGIRQAHRVLESDFPTRNVAWVNAARLILRAREMAKAIVSDDHRAAWDLFREEWRIRFYGRLRASPEYFCGVGDWGLHVGDVTIDDGFASRIASATHLVVEFKAPNIGATSYTEKLVSENAIKVVYDFTEYDDEWRDPIQDRSGFDSATSDAMFQRNFMGLWGYIELRRKYLLSMGSAKRRNDVNQEDAE